MSLSTVEVHFDWGLHEAEVRGDWSGRDWGACNRMAGPGGAIAFVHGEAGGREAALERAERQVQEGSARTPRPGWSGRAYRPAGADRGDWLAGPRRRRPADRTDQLAWVSSPHFRSRVGNL